MIHRYLPFTLTLRSPAVISSLAGEQNSTRTLPFIPGSALRGAVARTFGDPGRDDEIECEFRTLVLDGTVCFLNAYPVDGERRTVPMPVSLRVVKDQALGSDGSVTAHDLAAYQGNPGLEGPEEHDGSWPAEALAATPGPFVSLLAAQPRHVAPRRQGRVHQQRDRSRGRAWTEETNGRETPHGTIFAFESLEAGQRFAGVLLVRGESDGDCAALVDQVKGRLQGPLLLGRSRRGGYGGDAVIEWGDLRERELGGQGLIAADLATGTEFRMLLVSPVLIRDPETGQRDPAALLGHVREKLAGRAELLRHRWSFEVTGGFNRKWRLELPQALAVAAGSVVVLRATEVIPFVDLRAIEHEGLGERRTEGFGRIAFLEAASRVLTLRPVAEPQPAAQATETVPEIVRFAERRILDAALAQRIEMEAARLAASVVRPPSSSLLGRLRNVLRAEPAAAIGTLQTWLGNDPSHALKRPAMDQLRRCRIGADGSKQALDEWLRGLATDGWGRFGALVRVDAVAQRHHVVSESLAREVLETRSVALRAQLIDGLLGALARRKRGGATS
jgi:CRISPR-associated protein Csx10